MELDELKKSWEDDNKKNIPALNSNIMQLIRNKSYGPLASIKNSFKRGLIAIPLVIILTAPDLFTKPEIKHNPFIWISYSFIIAVGIYFWYNYKKVTKIQNNNLPVKETIQENITTIENSLKRYYFIGNCFGLFIIVFIEGLGYFHKVPSAYTHWFTYPVYIRICIYFILLILFYFLQRRSFKKHFEQHIYYLKKLLQEL